MAEVIYQPPLIMGIINATPDSFSDGGRYNSLDTGITRVAQLLEEGADVIDIGGESTRPGASPVSLEQETQRVLPLVKAVRQAFPQAKISVDTSSPDLMKACLDEGVWMINDVRALTRPGAIEVCAGYDANLCLMHMQGEPQTMQQRPTYGDLVTEVEEGLMQRVLACREAGIAAERIWLDPGFGFGKSLAHNYQLLAQLKRIAALGFPLLIGVSRKSMIGQVLPELSPSERDVGSLAAALWALEQGAGLLRVHNVKMMKEGLAVWQMIQAHKE